MYPGVTFVIDGTKLYAENGVKILIRDFLRFYNHKTKIVPDKILNDKQSHDSFLAGYKAGSLVSNDKGQVGTSGIFYIMKMSGLDVSVISGTKLRVNDMERNDNPGVVKSIIITDLRPDYVYDLETESGRFQAGIGTMIVKNTDSIYTQFMFPDDSELSKEEKLTRTWKLASECADRISVTFRKPIELEMEKIMWPLYLYGKKRYACKVYEQKRDGTFSSKRDLKGIQAVRRDNCKLVKSVSKPVFDQLLDENNTQGAIDVVKHYVNKLFNDDLDVSEFVVTKSINSNYKALTDVKGFIDGSVDIEDDFVMVNGRKMSIPGHVILAKKLRQRKVMNPPHIGDRIPFVYVKNPNPKAKGGERMECPNYVMENKLVEIDPMFYMEKQLASPLYTIFEVLVTDSNGDLYPRKIKVDKKTGKETSEISKECKQAIDELLWNEIIRNKCPGVNFFIKKSKVDKNQKKISDLFGLKK